MLKASTFYRVPLYKLKNGNEMVILVNEMEEKVIVFN